MLFQNPENRRTFAASIRTNSMMTFRRTSECLSEREHQSDFWATVYSSGKYEVSHGLSSLLGFGEMRCVACLWGMVPRGSSYFSSEHTVYPPAGGYRVLSLLLLCGRCENGVNYTLMSNAGCVAAAQNIQWTIV